MKKGHATGCDAEDTFFKFRQRCYMGTKNTSVIECRILKICMLINTLQTCECYYITESMHRPMRIILFSKPITNTQISKNTE